MKDSLLTVKHKKDIVNYIRAKDYNNVISILEKIKTNHAGTAKTLDKRYTITEIVKFILDSSNNIEKDFFLTGKSLCNRKEDVSKEIGISIIWRGYKLNPGKTREYLLKIADDPNWEVREYAAGAFANIMFYNDDFYNDLIKWTKHPSENIRRAVVFSALGLRKKETLEKAFLILERLMFDDSKYVKKNLGPFILGSYFGNNFPKETIHQLKKWCKIIDVNVRWNIIMSFNNSFGNKYPSEGLEVLKNFTGNVDLSVKRALKSTLNFLSRRHKNLIDDFKKKYRINY